MRFLLLIILILSEMSYTQDIPSTSEGELKFYLDVCAFRGKESKVYQEFYLMIHADQLIFDGVENKKAKINLNYKIVNQKNEVISQKEWVTDVRLSQDSSDFRTLAVYDQWAELLNPGDYIISVEVTEQEHSKAGVTDLKFTVPVFDESEIAISDIEFISKIEEVDGDDRFVKNGRIVLPNPWRRYGILNPMLTFYYEIYNIQNSADDKFLVVDYLIRNSTGAVIKSMNDIKVKKSGQAKSVAHAIDISGLTSGVYTLGIEIKDLESETSCSESREFEIIQIDYLTQLPSLSGEELEISGKILEYIGTPQQTELFSGLSSEGKTQYIINFWKDTDPTPSTIENEYFESIMNRYHYSIKNFSWGKIEGFKTDKGRILIKYGMPDEIENFHSESNSKPYEIWKYSQDRNFIFVFGDINSNGKFILLHSTKEGEVSNYYWRDYLTAF